MTGFTRTSFQERIRREAIRSQKVDLFPELLEALQAVYADIELQNVSGGSDELNLQVQAVLAKAEAIEKED